MKVGKFVVGAISISFRVVWIPLVGGVGGIGTCLAFLFTSFNYSSTTIFMIDLPFKIVLVVGSLCPIESCSECLYYVS